MERKACNNLEGTAVTFVENLQGQKYNYQLVGIPEASEIFSNNLSAVFVIPFRQLIRKKTFFC